MIKVMNLILIRCRLSFDFVLFGLPKSYRDLSCEGYTIRPFIIHFLKSYNKYNFIILLAYLFGKYRDIKFSHHNN